MSVFEIDQKLLIKCEQKVEIRTHRKGKIVLSTEDWLGTQRKGEDKSESNGVIERRARESFEKSSSSYYNHHSFWTILYGLFSIFPKYTLSFLKFVLPHQVNYLLPGLGL